MTDSGGHKSLVVGVARAIITPPIGLPLMGTLRDELSDEVENELTVTALYLTDGKTPVVIVGCDLIRVSLPMATSVRARVAESSGIPLANVFLNASHTHAVPAPPDWYEYDGELDPAVRVAVERYYAVVEDQIVASILTAVRRARPGRYGAAVGTARIGVNRREFLPDGTPALGENPDGPVDPDVTVLRFDALDGEPIGVLFHHACHPDVLGPKCRLISPDYVGAAREVVETVAGCPSVFLQGTAGDIDPRSGIVNPPDGVDALRRLGRELGCEVARVLQPINTTRVRDRRVAWPGTLSAVTGWNHKDVEGPPLRRLAAASRLLDMPLREVPPVAEAERVLDESERELAALSPPTSMLSNRLRARRRVAWAKEQLRAASERRPARLPFELQALLIDDVALVACPGELFVEIGLAIKERSVARTTMVSGYTNGLYFYVPTAAAFAQGGYEVESHRNFIQAAGPTPEWERILVEQSTQLINELAAVEPEKVPVAAPDTGH
jgi:hypothetical protein